MHLPRCPAYATAGGRCTCNPLELKDYSQLRQPLLSSEYRASHPPRPFSLQDSRQPPDVEIFIAEATSRSSKEQVFGITDLLVSEILPYLLTPLKTLALQNPAELLAEFNFLKQYCSINKQFLNCLTRPSIHHRLNLLAEGLFRKKSPLGKLVLELPQRNVARYSAATQPPLFNLPFLNLNLSNTLVHRDAEQEEKQKTNTPTELIEFLTKVQKVLALQTYPRTPSDDFSIGEFRTACVPLTSFLFFISFFSILLMPPIINNYGHYLAKNGSHFENATFSDCFDNFQSLDKDTKEDCGFFFGCSISFTLLCIFCCIIPCISYRKHNKRIQAYETIHYEPILEKFNAQLPRLMAYLPTIFPPEIIQAIEQSPTMRRLREANNGQLMLMSLNQEDLLLIEQLLTLLENPQWLPALQP